MDPHTHTMDQLRHMLFGCMPVPLWADIQNCLSKAVTDLAVAVPLEILPQGLGWL